MNHLDERLTLKIDDIDRNLNGIVVPPPPLRKPTRPDEPLTMVDHKHKYGVALPAELPKTPRSENASMPIDKFGSQRHAERHWSVCLIREAGYRRLAA